MNGYEVSAEYCEMGCVGLGKADLQKLYQLWFLGGNIRPINNAVV